MQLAHLVITLVWLAAGVLLSSPALAEQRSTEEVKPRAATATEPDPQALDELVGRWQVEARDPATGKIEKIRYEVRRFVGHTWLSGTGQSEDPGFQSKDVWGHDPITKEVIRIVFDGSGTYAIVRSPGWKEGTLVLEGDARSANGIVRVRETIKRVSPDEFHATWESLRDGIWRAYSVERMTRLPPA